MRSALHGLLLSTAALLLPSISHALADDQMAGTSLPNAHPSFHMVQSSAAGGQIGRSSQQGTVGVDSIPNFSSYFYVDDTAQDPLFFGFSWPYTMVGQSPFGSDTGTTRIRAPIIPVNLDLRNADGSPRTAPNGGPMIVRADTRAMIANVLASPVFSSTRYSSSDEPTQFTDALHRASFFHAASSDWHTMLVPVVQPAQTIVLLKGTYVWAANADGSCCAYVLVDSGTFSNALFPPTPIDTTTVLGAAENAGAARTTDITTLLFNNVYLYEGGSTANCCVLGFHSYDLEPGSRANGWRERRYVMNYSSWISPGIFSGGLADVTALSHEMSETFADPFVANATPIWLSPNGNCQNNLEVGDVIEGMTGGVHTVTMNGSTYHPQNEALLQWFADVTPSDAIGGAYSYPDPVLTAPAYYANTSCQ